MMSEKSTKNKKMKCPTNRTCPKQPYGTSIPDGAKLCTKCNDGTDKKTNMRKTKNPKYIHITETDTLYPGMLIAHKNKLSETFVILYANPHRDGLLPCLDDCGHTKLVDAWSGNYCMLPIGEFKYKVAFGKSPHQEIQISNSYYLDETDFRRHFPKTRFWYVEVLKGTIKFIKEKNPK